MSVLQNKKGILNQNGAFVLDELQAEDVALAMIKGCQKESFHIFDMDEAYSRIQYFRKLMPRIQIFYAIKANDWEMMLKLVISEGLGFDCASPGEIIQVIKLGISPTSILYAVTTKTREQMIFAREVGIKHTTFDSSYELKKIKQFWPDVNLLIRIRVDGESIYKLGDKFGCDFESEAFNLLDEAAYLDLKVVGVAFHVGSACSSVDSHSIGLQRARALFDHEANAGRRMKIVDIGGGFMGARTDDIDEVSQRINSALEEYFPEDDVQIVAEPGRYLVDSSATLYNSITNIRQIKKDGKLLRMIYLNDGVHGTLRYTEPWHTVEVLERGLKHNSRTEDEVDKKEAILWGPTGDSVDRIMENHDVYLPRCTPFDWLVFKNQEKELNKQEAIIWGPTCDSVDRVMENHQVYLPRCTPFDWLVFKNQGAYTHVFETHFSRIDGLKMRTVVSSKLWNQLKHSPVFSTNDFVLNPDLSTPLPTSLPPVPPCNKFKKNLNTTKLLVL